MRKINTFIIAITATVTLSTTVFAGDCSQLNDAMKSAFDKANDRAIAQVDAIMKKPDLSDLDSCLGGLSASLGGFSLGIPNLEDLLNQACEAIVDNVYDKAMDGMGGALEDIPIDIDRTNDPGFEFSQDDVQITEPDIDLKKSIDGLFN